MAEKRNGSFTRIRIIGISVILSLLIFVTIVDAIDGLFFADSYHVDASFYTLLAGLAVTFLGGEAIGFLARGSARDDGDQRG